MSTSIIIQRIAAACAAGELARLPETVSSAPPVVTMIDLLRNWSEVYPGHQEPEPGEDRDVFSHGRLRRPHVTPCVRRSFRPLPAPRPLRPTARLISPGLFASVRGIWDFYQARELADPALLQLDFNDPGLGRFVQPLSDAVSGWYPLYIPLEMLCEEGDIRDLNNIHLMLPHYTYDDEGAGVVEAFLTSLESIAGMMEHYLDDTDIELPDKDRVLIGEIGFMELVKVYEYYPGAKTVDLGQLMATGPDLFFDPLAERFPAQMAAGWPIISGDSGYDCDVPITCAQDIDFCLAYASTYERLINLIPPAYDFDQNEGGITEEFMHELCEVWRKSNHKRLVKWTSPKRARLSEVFRRERIAA